MIAKKSSKKTEKKSSKKKLEYTTKEEEKKEKPQLTHRQRIFVAEYAKDGNARRAAKAAGYSEKTATQMGYENLTKPYIKEEVEQFQSETHRKLGLNANWVLSRLMQIANRSMQAEPVIIYDKSQKREKHKIDEKTGEGIYQYDAPGANKALELLGKNMRLYIEKLEVTEDQNLYERYAKAKRLMREREENKEE